jgi:uncharacterized membrane protein YdjX (TVP38/TMEM64 family)
MLTEEEKKFIAWWEANRHKEKQVFRQWLIGLPVGMLFGIAIAVNFLSGWNKQAAYASNRGFNPIVLIVAVLIIITFVAIFSKKHKWEMNEQQYKEFKAKEDK